MITLRDATKYLIILRDTTSDENTKHRRDSTELLHDHTSFSATSLTTQKASPQLFQVSISGVVILFHFLSQLVVLLSELLAKSLFSMNK